MILYTLLLAAPPVAALLFLHHDSRAADKQAAQAFVTEVENYVRGDRG